MTYIMEHTKKEQGYWFVAAVIMALFSKLRGIRFPNLWSYSHYLFNYEYGFVKRGFLGEIISLIGCPLLMSYDFFFVFSLLLLLANLFFLLLIIRDVIGSGNRLLAATALIFACSLGIVYLTHTIGYFDHVGLLVVLIALRIKNIFVRIIFSFIAIPIVLLIHETALLLFFPVLLFSIIMAIDLKKPNKYLILTCLLAVLAVAFSTILSRSTIEDTQATAMYEELSRKVNHDLRLDAFSVLSKSTEDNVAGINYLWSKGNRAIRMALSLSVTAPLFLFFLYIAFIQLKKEKFNFWLILFALLAALSPLALHFAAWDMDRWNTITISTSFLLLYIISQNKNVEKDTVNNALSLRMKVIVVLMLFFGASSTIPLFDGYEVKQIPFTEHFLYLKDVINGVDTFPSVPNK